MHCFSKTRPANTVYDGVCKAVTESDTLSAIKSLVGNSTHFLETMPKISAWQSSFEATMTMPPDDQLNVARGALHNSASILANTPRVLKRMFEGATVAFLSTIVQTVGVQVAAGTVLLKQVDAMNKLLSDASLTLPLESAGTIQPLQEQAAT